MIFIKRLFLSYETIWYLDGEKRRSITIKRAVEQTTREENLDNKDTQRHAIKINRYCSFNAYMINRKRLKGERDLYSYVPFHVFAYSSRYDSFHEFQFEKRKRFFNQVPRTAAKHEYFVSQKRVDGQIDENRIRLQFV